MNVTLDAKNYRADSDPIAQGAQPSQVEVHSPYRHGRVFAVTFEKGDLHVCYGVDEVGNVWDACARRLPASVTDAPSLDFYRDGLVLGEDFDKLRECVQLVISQ